MSEVAGGITHWLIKNNAIIEHDKDLYAYGIRQGIIQLFSFISLFIVAFLMNGLFEIVVFTVAFMPLRINAGGYHARTELGCYAISMITGILVVLAIQLIPYTYFSIGIITLISTIIIYKLAPIEDANKLFDEKEKKVFTTRIRWILVLELLCIGIAAFLGNFYIIHIISLNLFFVVIALLVKCKNE